MNKKEKLKKSMSRKNNNENNIWLYYHEKYSVSHFNEYCVHRIRYDGQAWAYDNCSVDPKNLMIFNSTVISFRFRAIIRIMSSFQPVHGSKSEKEEISFYRQFKYYV